MRGDLLALTPATLAELTNRGLVKRATRELEKSPPTLAEDDDRTVRATFDDGIETRLPTGGLEGGACSCGAPGVCRHLVGLVLAYLAQNADAQPADAQPATSQHAEAQHAEVPPAAAPPAGVPAGPSWSPGRFSDEQVEERIGQRMMTAARRLLRAGFVARVHRGLSGDPVPSVELPTATVRFLVPDDLGFVRSDAAAGAREDVLALAVWAFRAADAQAPGQEDAQVQVGGEAGGATGAGLPGATALGAVVLREGAVHLGAGLAVQAATVRRELEAARMRWPLLALEDLVGQLDAYRERSARYRPQLLADHVAELFARHRSVTGGGAALRSRVLGTDEASETPLRRARLDGLGARVTTVGGERVVETYLAHASSASVLVLRRAYETADTGPELAKRRVAGVSLAALAGGAVVTETAIRSASREVRLGTRRLSRTEAMVSRGAWQDLPPSILAASLTRLGEELDALPPRPIRARVAAELVRVVPVARVLSVSYAPGDQRLDALIADSSGATATLSAGYESCAPGRLDAMAAALNGSVRFVAGTVRRSGGTIHITPSAFALGAPEDATARPPGREPTAAEIPAATAGADTAGADTARGDAAGVVVVPDFAPVGRGDDPDGWDGVGNGPLGAALDDAAELLAEVAHRGLLHAPPTMPERLRKAAGRLKQVGLHQAGSSVEELAGRMGPDPGDEAVEVWVDAYLRVSVAADLQP